MTTHIMHDLETLATTPDSVIVSIGAVIIRDLELADKFYCVLDIDQKGRAMSASTVTWWMKQSAEARAVFSAQERFGLYDGLKKYYEFVRLAQLSKASRVWGNGADFDNAILTHAYKQLDVDPPWAYWQNGCYRTLKSVVPLVPATAFQGTEHNALADAEHQAKHFIEIMKYLGQR